MCGTIFCKAREASILVRAPKFIECKSACACVCVHACDKHFTRSNASLLRTFPGLRRIWASGGPRILDFTHFARSGPLTLGPAHALGPNLTQRRKKAPNLDRALGKTGEKERGRLELIARTKCEMRLQPQVQVRDGRENQAGRRRAFCLLCSTAARMPS